MTDEERKRVEQRLLDIQKERERLAREMEREVQKVQRYIMLGAAATATNTKRK